VRAFGEFSCELDKFDAAPTLWWEGDALVIRWWLEGTCGQAAHPTASYRNGEIDLAVRRGDKTRCGHELALYTTRVEGLSREPQRLVIDGSLVPWNPAPAAPRRLRTPRCDAASGPTGTWD
jgi:hypothetical protein